MNWLPLFRISGVHRLSLGQPVICSLHFVGGQDFKNFDQPVVVAQSNRDRVPEDGAPLLVRQRLVVLAHVVGGTNQREVRVRVLSIVQGSELKGADIFFVAAGGQGGGEVLVCIFQVSPVSRIQNPHMACA